MRHININYYIGACGPTIRIDTYFIEDINKVRDIFIKLVNLNVQEVSIGSLENTNMEGLTDLIIKIVDKKKFYQKTIKRTNTSPNNIEFVWTLTKDECEYCRDLINSLIQSGKGHQYLVEEDDVIILLSYNENIVPM